MTHKDSPEYWTITSIDEYDGTPTCLGVFENMDAVTYRLKALYSHCGSEYRIECFHLQTDEHCAEQYNDTLVNRRKYQKEEAEKEAALKELAEIKAKQKEEEVIVKLPKGTKLTKAKK